MLSSLRPKPGVVRKKENALNAARKISEIGSTVESGTPTPKRTMKVPSRERMRRTGISHVE
jgi:hypothetical protein